MYISHAIVENFRALEQMSSPLDKLSIIIGENDVGKTSFLHALNVFFSSNKISDENDFFKKEKNRKISIQLTFSEVPEKENLKEIRRKNGDIVVRKTFGFDESAVTKVILDSDVEKVITKKVVEECFSSDNFHFIPVRRDLAVQFSMAKTALLGKTLRAKMKNAVAEKNAKDCLGKVEEILTKSLEEPKIALQNYLQEQMHNKAIGLKFYNLQVDPIEGVNFEVRLSDDKVDDIVIENRGAGTQNNLIIALFRLVASIGVGNCFIFAMEEPENSLHPKAQRQLLSVLQEISRNSQVICTTHSPIFIERSKFENNILFNRTIKGNTIVKTFNISMLGQLRKDLGIRPSDALLKGGGNCAILIEGNTEEEGFPVFMEMLGLSEFQLGIALINLEGSDKEKVRNTALLLEAYDIPCVIVLDKDAKKTTEDIEREKTKGQGLKNVEKIFCLEKGSIEDYYPLEIVALVINEAFKPKKEVKASDFDESKHGKDRLNDFKHVMYEHGVGEPLDYLKRMLGSRGTEIMKEKKMRIDPELEGIFKVVKEIAEKQ